MDGHAGPVHGAAEASDTLDGSPRPRPRRQEASEQDEQGTQSHGATQAICKACHRVVGEFFNSWLKVTGSAIPSISAPESNMTS
ncbi:hypothetical protein DM02DRAFT_656321 [Periconia macrospinosa]|uniref:Uncharacterized protein n=1 Tax=Periconia macrospinosa TaxID=97972 RepID=A0A2V1DQ93_9PLEO|nr:hypothetical protein DM02DRAFT_656321 [Periconia macrospinosa]